MTKLPPWSASNEREQIYMHAWVNWHLDQVFDDDFMESQRKAAEAVQNLSFKKIFRRVASAAAKRGDLEPLRNLVNEHRDQFVRSLAPFINRPKQKRGQALRRVRRDWHLERAVGDVTRIRKLWKEHYGKQNRIGLRPTAEEIAAARWGVTEEQVINRLKKSPAK